MSSPTALIVEDDEAIRIQLKYALQGEFRLVFAESRPEALAAAAAVRPAVVLLDLGLPPTSDTTGEGLKALEELCQSSAKVIVLTGHSERKNALAAVQLGAFDYQLKPIDLDTLRVMMRRAVYLLQLEHEGAPSLAGAETTTAFEELLGTTPAMQDIFKIIQRVAKTDATVLIEGESGTGKELIAAAIHQRSPRRSAPFIAVNCGAIPEPLVESELFGHQDDGFTRANGPGKLELADHATLFLDEIGELSLLLQVKLLRFLQHRTIERRGQTARKLDLRIITAADQDLRALLKLKRFRQDLYYRLSVVVIRVPPLRERGEDIALLANAFLRRACHQHRRTVTFSSEAVKAMMAYSWPGNIRELENKVTRSLIMEPGRTIGPAALELTSPPEGRPALLRQARQHAERQALVTALARNHGNISRAARELQVSRPTIHSLLDKHAIDAQTFR